MIPRSAGIRQIPAWQQSLAEAITDPEALISALDLPATLLESARLGTELFPLRVPRAYLDKMTPGDPHDPLLLQVLPLHAETRETPGYESDPVGDLDAFEAPGTLHKYQGRVLLNTTQACALHCRYCFRRNFPYAEIGHGPAVWDDTMAYIGAHPDIHEIILSGGDPLSLSNTRLQQLISRLEDVTHLETLRLHSRFPVVLPSRIEPDLITLLSNSRFKVVLVAHCNHPNELDDATAESFSALRGAGITLLNQSVLLKDINASVDCLTGLSRRLFDQGVLPYYLHAFDRVSGAAHFDTGDEVAIAIHRKLAASLPGYLVPRLVREIAGQPNKTLLGF